jgi:hypothetical protein
MICTGLKYQGEISLNYQYRLFKNEGQEGKASFLSVGTSGSRRAKGEGEYGGCILYSCVVIEQ